MRIQAGQWQKPNLWRSLTVARLVAKRSKGLRKVVTSRCAAWSIEAALWGVGSATALGLRLGRSFSAARGSAARTRRSVRVARGSWVSHRPEAMLWLLTVGLALAVGVTIARL